MLVAWLPLIPKRHTDSFLGWFRSQPSWLPACGCLSGGDEVWVTALIYGPVVLCPLYLTNYCTYSGSCANTGNTSRTTTSKGIPIPTLTMRDPFPLPPIPWLSDLITPLSTRYALYTLPLHIHEVLFFTALYTFIQIVVSPRASRRLFPQHYGRLSARTRVNWDVHVVSLVQSVLACALALWVMRTDGARVAMDEGKGDGLLDRYFGPSGFEDRVWGYTGALGLVQAAGCGYFLWDFLVSVMHTDMFGVGMLAHAVCALTVFSFGFVRAPFPFQSLCLSLFS